jgi:hypothetical protein
MTDKQKIAKLEKEIEEMKTRLLQLELRQQTIIIQQPPAPYYSPQPNPFLPPYIVTC